MTYISTIQKNAREEIRISLDEYHGHQLVNMRVWYTTDTGEMRPGKQGLAFKIDRLPEIVEALHRASALLTQEGV